jgi:NitT/TauT family transport system ATP-binding protein
MSHIEARGLTKLFPHNGSLLMALKDVDFSVKAGEFVSVIGPSGCGKSTLLRLIGGLLEPTGGSVHIDGQPPREAQRSKQMGFVFQDPSLLPWRTVLGNVRLPLEVNGGILRHVSGQAKGNAFAPEELVDLVGLEEFADYYPHQLSGGMQQRVALARSLVFGPSLLLMDEPLGSLDEITRGEMRYELLRVWERSRQTVLLVTHSIPEAVLLSDRIIVLSHSPGRVRAVLEIDLPRPRAETLEDAPRFRAYVGELRALLR